MKYKIFLVLASSVLTACGGGSNSGNDEQVLSYGLKIFVTAESHVGDFANDPTLNGNTGIERADSFCNNSTSKPNNSTYKALLVDGINRDAISLTDWVLEPSTAYYRPYNNIRIGATNSASIFLAFWSNLENPIIDCTYDCFMNEGVDVWTGIDDAKDFSTNGNTCDSWTSSSTMYRGRFGMLSETDGFAFSSNLFGSCSLKAHVYCVEQP